MVALSLGSVWPAKVPFHGFLRRSALPAGPSLAPPAVRAFVTNPDIFTIWIPTSDHRGHLTMTQIRNFDLVSKVPSEDGFYPVIAFPISGDPIPLSISAGALQDMAYISGTLQARQRTASAKPQSKPQSKAKK